MNTRPPFALVIAVLAAAMIPAVFWGLFSGSVPLPPRAILDGFLFALNPGMIENAASAEIAAALIFRIRLPRLILAALVGASLGIAGAAFQGLFRNSLADPYITGRPPARRLARPLR